jgi:hypothetical protein
MPSEIGLFTDLSKLAAIHWTQFLQGCWLRFLGVRIIEISTQFSRTLSKLLKIVCQIQNVTHIDLSLKGISTFPLVLVVPQFYLPKQRREQEEDANCIGRYDESSFQVYPDLEEVQAYTGPRSQEAGR